MCGLPVVLHLDVVVAARRNSRTCVGCQLAAPADRGNDDRRNSCTCVGCPVSELKGANVDEVLKRVNNDSQLRGYALRWGQKGRGGFRCPPQTLLDLPFPSPDDQGCDPGPRGICEDDHTAPGPGPQSWSFQGGMGVQRDVGGKSKSPLIPLGPAQRASPEDGHLQSLLVNTCALLKIIIQLNRRTGNPVRRLLFGQQ